MKDEAFRFQSMEIWQRAADISTPLFELAEALDGRKYYRFAEQLRAATLSITNNIAEGSGSDSDDDFSNLLMLFARKGYLGTSEVEPLLEDLQEQSKMLLAFRRALKRPR